LIALVIAVHELVDRKDEIELLSIANANLVVIDVLLNLVVDALVADTLSLISEVQNAIRISDLMTVIDVERVVRLSDTDLRRVKDRADLFDIDTDFIVLEASLDTNIRLIFRSQIARFQFG
jgi:ethanolamine utilization cobalamin adenosyltransferase